MKRPTFIYFLDEASFLYRLNFFVKLAIFTALSILAILIKDTLILASFSLVILFIIASTGFFSFNPKPLRLLFFALLMFGFFWSFLSRIQGEIIYIAFPWGTFISENTFRLMATAICRWSLIVLSGLIFMLSASEEQMIDALISIKTPKKIIFTMTIAFNTVGFTMKDIELIDYALISRNYNDRALIGKMKRVFYVGSNVLLSSLKKIETLNHAYLFRDYSNMQDKNER